MPQELLIEEGPMKQTEFYLLLEGELEVFTHGRNELSHLSEGALVGETSLLLEKERTASIRATTESYVLAIPASLIFEFNRNHPDLGIQILENIHRRTFAFLKIANQKISAILDKLRNMGLFIINFTAYISVYSAAVIYLNQLIHINNPIWVTTPLVLIGCMLLFIRMYLTRTPLSNIGITKRNLKRSIYEALIATGLLILFAFFLKYAIEFSMPQLYANFKSAIVSPYSSAHSYKVILLFMGIYCVHAFFQEVLIRGALQGMFRTFFIVKYGNAFSIVLASLVFAAAHAYFGIQAVLSMFAAGIYWGYLYSRTGNIFGVALSHIIIGNLFLGNDRWFFRWLYGL